MRIAVDFDGTIVEHAYPRIGKPLTDAFDTLIKLNNAGHKLILWTYRHGELLQEAVDFCAANGVHFYAVNANEPQEKWKEGHSRLIRADVFIDDRNVGGLYAWAEVEKIISNHQTTPL
jgi:hypothetical protein